MIRNLPIDYEAQHRIDALRKLVGDNQHHEITYQEYGILNWRCELLPYFTNITPLFGEFRILETHHIAKRGKFAEVVGNWISVCRPVHQWLESHGKPGFVICAYHKTSKGEQDWDCWTACQPKRRLLWLETDECIAACEPWPVIDDMRQVLLQGN